MWIKNSPERIGVVTRLLHWTVAVLILFLTWLGWYMVDLTYFDKWYNDSLHWHKSLGMIVLGLALFKIAWQLYSPPPHAAVLNTWERRAATTMHLVLLAMMVLIPVTGFLISTSSGQAVKVFNWFEVPALISRNESVRDLAIELHFYLAYGTIALVLGHAGAALQHQFINRDGTLVKMLWR